MRKQDIQLMTEYAETAPLAYGREPHTVPVRVRFTDLRNAVWVVAWTEKVYSSGDARTSLAKGWRAVTERQIMTRAQAWADGYAERPNGWMIPEEINVGDQRKVYESTDGALPAERFINDHWVPGVVRPASVHRTWAEVQAKHDRSKAESEAARATARVAEVADLLERLGLGDMFEVGIRHTNVGGQTFPIPSISSTKITGGEMVERLQALADRVRPRNALDSLADAMDRMGGS